MTTVAKFLIACRLPLLFVALSVAIASSFASRRLGFDRSIENMFASDDPLLAPYEKLKRVFGGNEVVVAVYEDAKAFSSDGAGFARLKELTSRLRQVEGVRDAMSLAELDQSFQRVLGKRLIQADDAHIRQVLRLFENYTHSEDHRIVAIVVMLVPEDQLPKEQGTDPRRRTVDNLKKIIETQSSGVLAGEPVMVVDGFRYLEEDGVRLGWVSTLLLGLTIILFFRSLRWVLIPVVVVQWSLLLTRAILVLSGLRLSMVSSMLTAIVTVTGVACVVHIIVHFREHRLTGRSPREALISAIAILGLPVFWTCVTDAVGFGSLLIARVGPVQDFGVMMAIGSLSVLISVAVLLPGMALLGKFDQDPKRVWREQSLDRTLQRIVRSVQLHPWAILLVTVLSLVIAAYGATRLQVESDFTRNFRDSSSIVHSYRYVEDRLGGAGVWDVMIPAPPPNELNGKFLDKITRLEERLRNEVSLVDERPWKVISLADAVRVGSPVELKHFPDFVRDRMTRVAMTAMQQSLPAFYAAMYGADPLEPGQFYLRIMLRAAERQPSNEKLQLIQAVERICQEESQHFLAADGKEAAQVTGFFVLLANLIDSMLADQWRSFAVAVIGIGLTMLLAFRDLRFALIALVPNILPIVLVMGLMGWLGFKINMGAAMIAAVSMGLSVDSSIHYISSFIRARGRGLGVSDSLLEVQSTVGRAMFFSTLALIVGFAVLCTSQFVPMIYFGALVSLSMLGGLIGNLVVLPALIKIAVR